MGYMSIFALKHDQLDPSRTLDVTRDGYVQSSRTTHDSIILERPTEAQLQESGDEIDLKRRLRAFGTYGDQGLYAGKPVHTSSHGTLILTSDYMIDLPLYKVFGDLPAHDEASKEAALALSGDALVDKMATDYRKAMVKARASLKSNGLKSLVMARKLAAHDQSIAQTLPEIAQEGADLTGYIWVDYDCIHEDNRDAQRHLPTAEWQALIRDARNMKSNMADLTHRPIRDYSSLTGPLTVDQQDVFVLQYQYRSVWHGVRLTRQRRSLPGDLYPDHLRFNEPPGAVLANDYPLMREFFASQGVRIQL